MKKFLFTVLAVFMLAGAANAQEAFPDIPAGHWAGEAVARIADLGIVIGFPDGTFRGNESFTRYQAALVISRLLDVIQQDMDAMAAMTEADLASLRNALQELASDVAAQGVRLNAVEGSVASLSDDVVSNTARIEALEAMGGMEMDPAVLEDLRNQIAAVRTAADTAAAQAAAAENLANSADARSRQNADEISTINDLLAEFNRILEEHGHADSGMMEMPDMSGLEGRVDRNTNDIANIREFVILLRRDQVALRDRVAALEAADAEQAAQLSDLAARVTAIEDDLLVVSGSIGLTYEVGRLSGSFTPFDVDRIFGLNNERDMGPSTFGDNADDLNDDDDETDDGEEAQDRDDISIVDGDVDPDLELTVGFGTARSGTGDDRALNSFDTVITLKLEKATNLCPDDDFTEAGGCPLDDDDDSQYFDGYVFTVDDFSVNFDPIGAEPLTFLFGSDIQTELTPYILDFDDGEVVDSYTDSDDLDVGDVDGFVATVGSPDFLSFLAPTLTVVYGSEDGDDDDTYYRAIRGTLSPLQGETFSATGGVTAAQRAENAGENADAANNNVTTTVYGIDGQIGVSILDIDFAYNMSSTTGDNDIDGSNFSNEEISTALAYVQVSADVESFPIIESLDINYRDIPGIWAGFADDDNYVFELDQAGFKVAAGLGIFIFDVSGYFDSYITGNPNAQTTAFGVDVAAELFRALSLTGFFHSVSTDEAAAGTMAAIDEIDDTERDDNDYDTGWGVGIKHDGSADNALVPNLNLEFEYGMLGADFDETHILAAADYELAISILTLTPYVSFESFNDAADGSDDTTEIKAGTGLTTEPLGIFLEPSFMAAVNYRTNAHTDTGADDYTASELQWSVGLMLNKFLFENSTLTAKYGSYTGTNMTLETNSNGSGDDATDISAGDEDNGATQATTGYEIIWDYWDLEFAYGAYTDSITNSDGGTADRNTGGQYFRIDYTVNF